MLDLASESFQAGPGSRRAETFRKGADPGQGVLESSLVGKPVRRFDDRVVKGIRERLMTGATGLLPRVNFRRPLGSEPGGHDDGIGERFQQTVVLIGIRRMLRLFPKLLEARQKRGAFSLLKRIGRNDCGGRWRDGGRYGQSNHRR